MLVDHAGREGRHAVFAGIGHPPPQGRAFCISRCQAQKPFDRDHAEFDVLTAKARILRPIGEAKIDIGARNPFRRMAERAVCMQVSSDGLLLLLDVLFNPGPPGKLDLGPQASGEVRLQRAEADEFLYRIGSPLGWS